MRFSSAWVVASVAHSYGLTPEQADEVFAVVQTQTPAGSPSGFLGQFEAAATDLGFLPTNPPAPEGTTEEPV